MDIREVAEIIESGDFSKEERLSIYKSNKINITSEYIVAMFIFYLLKVEKLIYIEERRD